jgi:uncharacterized protein YbjQ (UPF0145 family)
MTFDLTDEKILDAGDKVAAKHITQVQKIVQKKLETLENELKDQRAKELEDLKMDAGRVKADADMKMEALRSQLEEQTSVSSNNPPASATNCSNCARSPSSAKSAIAN